MILRDIRTLISEVLKKISDLRDYSPGSLMGKNAKEAALVRLQDKLTKLQKELDQMEERKELERVMRLSGLTDLSSSPPEPPGG